MYLQNKEKIKEAKLFHIHDRIIKSLVFKREEKNNCYLVVNPFHSWIHLHI